MLPRKGLAMAVRSVAVAMKNAPPIAVWRPATRTAWDHRERQRAVGSERQIKTRACRGEASSTASSTPSAEGVQKRVGSVARVGSRGSRASRSSDQPGQLRLQLRRGETTPIAH